MRSAWRPFLSAASAALFVLLTSPAAASILIERSTGLLPRDGHGHHDMHAAPLTVLNETEVTLNHAPTPESYYTIDIDGAEPTGKRYPWLMMSHVILMMLAFFIALPIGISMRGVRHAWHGVVVAVFYGLCILGCAASALYTKLTPNMYEGQVHSKQGYWILALAVALTVVDIWSIVARIYSFFRSGDKFTLRSFWFNTILGRDGNALQSGEAPEYAGLVSEEPEDMSDDDKPNKHVHYDVDIHGDTAEWANHVNRHTRDLSHSSDATLFRSRSTHSDETLQEAEYTTSGTNKSLLKRVGGAVFDVAERSLVIMGFAQVLTGIVIYTGGCRQNYLNGCLAHLIKGCIFWCYGLLTFGRFLGAFSELGWAWNRAPAKDYPSAEFVESFVIFLYGITNTWMERFGASPGDPYTTKEIQHIGIAVMFWFAGLLGMGLESKVIRKWLASTTIAALKPTGLSKEAVAEPPSYSASFNPFPAMVIGVTGSAMAAHFQTYLFQVQIHELWGNLLLGFSVLRCLTYFFVWISPPRSILPSRPPTEALGSFFLACGGLTFMFSTEELSIAAMRRGRDDVMMFLNVGVAITCLAMCWTTFVVGFNGWLRSHVHNRVSYHDTA